MKRIATVVALGAVAYYQILHAPVNAESGLFENFLGAMEPMFSR